MIATLKRISAAIMLLSGMASIYLTLGTLNGRVPGGLTPMNKPWLIAVSVFGISLVLTVALKLLSPLFDDTTALH